MAQDNSKHNPDSRDLTNLSSGDPHWLILHNDEVNTFIYVIDCLVQVCGHDSVQAEQCALITHHQGKCDVRKGEYAMLLPMKEDLLTRGLLVTID
jgi:ATP-dependent Clp protease adaptor protein ClpS